MSRTDDELKNCFLKNDPEAFDRLFHQYKSDVYRFILYLTRNKQEAEDIFQETWLRVVRNLKTLNEVRDLKAWIFTIAMNLFRDQIRQNRFHRLFMLPLKNKSEDDDQESIIPTVRDSSRDIDIQQRIQAALQKLSEKQRQIFILKEIEGFKHEEISEMLHIPVGTIKSLLHRAISKLQKELIDYQKD
ncbi:RNA polymerase sigma factor [candidate division KSB1 bacterium]|nr:RNA polymerase sigma factor [candidate division KSB1 bacterium]